MVRTFGVMSSPCVPSPRVTPSNEQPILVYQAEGNSVYLELRGVCDLFVCQVTPQARVKLDNFLLRVGVVEAEA